MPDLTGRLAGLLLVDEPCGSGQSILGDDRDPPAPTWCDWPRAASGQATAARPRARPCARATRSPSRAVRRPRAPSRTRPGIPAPAGRHGSPMQKPVAGADLRREGYRDVQSGPDAGRPPSTSPRRPRAPPCTSTAGRSERPRAAVAPRRTRPSAPLRAPDPPRARRPPRPAGAAPAPDRDRRRSPSLHHHCHHSCSAASRYSQRGAGQPANARRSPRSFAARICRPRWSRERTVPIAHPAAFAASW